MKNYWMDSSFSSSERGHFGALMGKEKWKCCYSVTSDSATMTRQAPLSTGFPRQEYWSGLPFPSAGDLPNPGIKPTPLHWQKNSLPTEPSEKALHLILKVLFGTPRNWLHIPFGLHRISLDFSNKLKMHKYLIRVINIYRVRGPFLYLVSTNPQIALPGS